VPAREYVACFVAAGAVAARSDEPADAEVGARIALLKERAAQRPPVTYRPRANIKRPGTLIRCSDTEIVFREPKGVVTRIPTRDALKIDLVDARRPHAQKRLVKLQVELGILRGLMAEDAESFLAHSQLDCVIAASDAPLREEANASIGLVTDSGWTIEGCIQDIIRVRRFGKEGDIYRSDVQVSGNSRLMDIDACPPIVIFDGAAHFLRSSGDWPNSSWIVILDRTEARYADGLAEIALIWDTRRREDHSLDVLMISESLECSVFSVDTI
jgi:hypothetical protein